MTDSKSIILECLKGVSSPNNEERQQAEQKLQFLETQQGYGVALVQLTLDKQVILPFRQLASLSLKRYIKYHWSDSETNFTPPLVHDEDRVLIKQLLPNALGDSEGKLRTGAAMSIATIAHWDWPEQWPQLVENLIGCLRQGDVGNSENPNLVKGAIRCLDIFCDGDNLSDEYLPQLMNWLFPEMLRIFNDTQNYSLRVRTRCVCIMRSLSSWLAITKSERKQDVKTFFSTIAPNCMTRFAQVLNEELVVPGTRQIDCGLKIAVTRVLMVLVNEFPSAMKSFLPVFITPMWNILVNGLGIFEKAAVYVEEEDDVMASVQDSDGEVLSVESLLSQVLELVHSIVEAKPLAALLRPALTDLVSLLVGYSQMTCEQVEMWTSDGNQYVADEDDEFNNFSVRSTAKCLAEQLASEFHDEGLKAIATACTKRLQQAQQMIQSNNPYGWKLQESVLLILGSLAGDFMDASDSKIFDMNGFAKSIVLPSIQQSNPFLKGRALWCVSQFASQLEQEVIQASLHSAVLSLQANNEPIPVRVGACRAVASFCPKIKDKAILAPYTRTIITGTSALLRDASEEILLLVLDTLLVAVRVDPAVTAEFEASVLTPYLCAVWSNNTTEVFVCEVIKEIFAVLASIPACTHSVQEKLLYPILTVLKAPKEMPGLTQTSIGLMHEVVKASPSLNEHFVTGLFPPLLALLLRTEDTAVLEEGGITLSVFIRKVPEQLVQWKIENHTAFELIIQFAAKLLNNTVDNDIAAVHVGPVLNALFAKMAAHLAPFLTDMLRAVVVRLQTAQHCSLIQSLVLVFARLLHTYTSEVLNFLAELTLTPNEKCPYTNALVFVTNLWTKWHIEFQGVYSIKLSISALAKLFSLNDKRLDGIIVQGEKVVQQQEGIVTRSKTKKQPSEEKWTQVTLKTKIAQILVREYQIQLEEEEMQNNPEDDGEYDEEDEEYDGDDDPFSGKKNYTDAQLAKMLGLDGITGRTGAFMDASLLFDEDDAEYEDEATDDPDLLNDPIYQMNIKEFVKNWFKSLASTDPNTLMAIGSQLNPAEQDVLRQIVA